MQTKIDWSAPIALENGASAVFVGMYDRNGLAQVRIEGSCRKNGRKDRFDDEIWVYESDGTWSGDYDGTKWRVVNVDDSASFIPEDWS